MRCRNRVGGRTWPGSSTTTSCTPSPPAGALPTSPRTSGTGWTGSPSRSASTSPDPSRWSLWRRSWTRCGPEPYRGTEPNQGRFRMGQDDFSDVLIIGAGISGIGAAYRIHEKNPNLTYTVLERRARIGGTWDLFRYPGIRSDSDIFTLSYPYEPWRRPENVADGGDIRDYLTETARKHGIDDHIQFNTRVLSADWDSTTDTWTVQTEQDGLPKTYRARFVFFGTGYYNYDEPYKPDFPGIEQFTGEVVHPQHWPESLHY